MNGILEIKEVDESKFDEIWPILYQVIQDEDVFPHSKNISKDEAKAYWFAPQAKVYNAYLDGKIIASRYIVPNKPALGSHICNIGVIVDKAYRGKGYGKIFNDFAIETAKALGYQAIQLNFVVSTNTASIKICQQNGFDIIGTIPNAFFYKQERFVDAYIMFKKLT